MTPNKKNPILDSEQIITVEGTVIYNDRRRRIDVKKPIRDLFEHGAYNVGYVMELCLNENTTAERIKELAKKNIKPVLLYFTKNCEVEQDV